ncbi:MAG: hypothetical protein M3R38_30835 [Actinomycetota bacterium]|nr:hypothetical protein [Actinomycetota bacterium]
MSNRQLDDRGMEAFEEEVELLAEERGISFSAALALKTGEAAPTATKKRTAMAKADLEELREGMRELQERSIRNLEMACGQQFTRMCEDGTIEKHAKERGLPYQDAFRELQDEVYAPLAEAQLRRSGRGFGSGTPVMTEGEERVQQGFTNKEVEWRAKSRGIPYREAFNQLSDEYAAKEAVRLEEREGASAVFLDEQAERRLDDEARAYAERHNCTYTTALETVLEEM